ncbi:RnfABCDGE type electron transport complex subunit D [Pseudothauera nasutitermitis]|uniref:Ion-translocating oxidoreductase complex subunit D n=1 Tax=Pseudothauera nasutitermitis TaxID=2565930 RepID=A0A4S4AXF8_9RHOO|nr:RnfABCDGE type electron transport complex subunit D [Pseudothauera nasutitermitis]THF64600.1 RnfABCDGE type electron transport complex subunit D [Pseudothauera nasutitermitis]
MNLFVSSPHAHGARPVGQVMLLVMLALLPATLAGFWHFGWPAIYLWLVTVISCAFTETLCVRLTGRKAGPALADGSAVLTGWLLALSLPPWAPWWAGVIGGAFAMVVCKHAFGGLGQNLFNPAMAARVMLLISFPVEMTQWLAPVPLGSAEAPSALGALAITFGAIPDGMTSASLLDHVRNEATQGITLSTSLTGVYDPLELSVGVRAGSMGETTALLLAGGGIFLLFMRVIGVRIPAAFLLGIALPAALAHFLAPERYLPPMAHLLAGGVMLGAFFIATDYVTSPSTPLGQWVFGLGCGLLTWIIRTWGAYPEGVAFAVLLMNAATPLIDHYTRPRIFGRTRSGRSLPPAAPKGN